MFALHSSGRFSALLCPLIDQCALPNCIFNHDRIKPDNFQDDFPDRESAKRRKLHDKPEALPAPRPKPKPFTGSLTKAVPKTPRPGVTDELKLPSAAVKQAISNVSTIQPSISPPPLRRSNPSLTPAKKESLNPRKLRKDPAGHATRLLYLQKLHEGMVRLNQEVSKATDPATRALALTNAQLITMALDEEEKFATESPVVYGNVIKLRMVAYKKMTMEQWTKARLEIVTPKMASTRVDKGEGPVLTGLTTRQELSILPHLFAKQDGLEKFGYVITPPTAKEIANAKAGVESSAGYEQCDRCNSRFQVFPDRRREDAALTAGEPCTYHYGRRDRPQNNRLDASMGQRDTVYSCCGESIGVSAGCVTTDTHVFKVNDIKRLASLWQFKHTPPNDAPTDRAVSFDCEMCYTVHGMELVRVTATAWPTGAELLDVLVRPLGSVLDLNTRYSGVSREQFLGSLPYNETSKDASNGLRIVRSPEVARDLLFKLISPSTPLIGHAIENDLNVMRILHPCIIDTALLFPHPRGLPYRRSLKALTKQLLSRDIQISTAKGHDSKEDAQATGDLVLVKVKHKWREMQSDGWSIVGGQVTAPADSKGVAQQGKRGRAYDV